MQLLPCGLDKSRAYAHIEPLVTNGNHSGYSAPSRNISTQSEARTPSSTVSTLTNCLRLLPLTSCRCVTRWSSSVRSTRAGRAREQVLLGVEATHEVAAPASGGGSLRVAASVRT